MIHPMIGMPQGAEWLVILAIVVLVFGAAKLPDLARGTGQALRIFKAETKGLKDDDADDDAPAGTTPTQTQPELETRPSGVTEHASEHDTEADRIRRGDSV
jgi:sec-independent protein translocase protein TatA